MLIRLTKKKKKKTSKVRLVITRFSRSDPFNDTIVFIDIKL